MKERILAMTIAVTVLELLPLTGASAQTTRGHFTYDGVVDCHRPPVKNFPIHTEATGTLSTDRSAELDVRSNVEGVSNYRAKLGARPTEAPGGSASLRVTGRSSLRAVREYPNNYLIATLSINRRTGACAITVDNRLKPGKREYTFLTPSGDVAYCDRPRVVRTSCEGL
jgi:hypothetical protein